MNRLHQQTEVTTCTASTSSAAEQVAALLEAGDAYGLAALALSLADERDQSTGQVQELAGQLARLLSQHRRLKHVVEAFMQKVAA